VAAGASDEDICVKGRQ